MTYIGSEPNHGLFHQQTFTGNGSTKSYTLEQYVADGTGILVTVGNIIQEEGSTKSYVASGNSLTFDSAPPNGDTVVIRFLGRAIDTKDAYLRTTKFKYVATASQTLFDSSDFNSRILSYTAGDIDVFLNGVRLDETDFTATNGTSVTLASAADSNDEIIISANNTVQLADVVPASGGTFGGNVAMNGQLTMNGTIPFIRSKSNLSTNHSVAAGFNNMVIGPFTIDSAVTLTIDSGATLTII